MRLDNIPEIYREHAYVHGDGTVFLPIYDENRNLKLTGYEYYQSLNKADTCPTETDAEKIARLEQAVQDLSDLVIMMSHQK